MRQNQFPSVETQILVSEVLDFKAEVVNCDVQSWMSRGVPDGNDWLRITRNLDKLKKISS
ncbi:hypothetical protein KUTeg_015492 [Tegillarca granosa]|uniref:Uncharacterized protein n=1 Tax=Tegillarca granosa TaxID=220873 RepID=A0ABQ9EVS9_TEGGR|nr:hypothetical protein KUTeg_015492 [Tegillarca granosa]